MKKRQRARHSGERGIALVYMAVLLTTLLLFSGLAVDGGRGYVVKAQLSKAVDGAALGAARNLNSGDPRAEAVRIFKANFPDGYFGTSSSTDPTADPGFFSLTTDAASGTNIVTVTASAVLPTTFMRLGNYFNMNVTSSGQATPPQSGNVVAVLSGRSGRRFATRRAPSSIHSMRRTIAWRSSPSATAPRYWTPCRRAVGSTRRA